jgi:hypothetical protein
VAKVAASLANTLQKMGRDNEAQTYETQAAKIRAGKKQ